MYDRAKSLGSFADRPVGAAASRVAGTAPGRQRKN
jgi:hypothetical protein